MNRRKKVAVGLSGGVDSSVAAALLKKQGHMVSGITMRIYDGHLKPAQFPKHACYGPDEGEDLKAAESVCKKLQIPYRVIDLREEYREYVINHFKDEYLAGRTPNPCIVCNRLLKFGFLLERAKRTGVDFQFFATGHYARIERIGDRYVLKRAVDHTKDQTYFLYTLTTDQLSTTIFPLGEFSKERVREIARSLGLTTADRSESQDFISNGDYSLLFSKKDEVRAGDIVDEQGNILGKHRGIIYYTIGQRRGLGINAGKPLYVKEIDAQRNRIVVSGREGLLSQGLIARDIILNPVERIHWPLQVKLKIRFNSKAFDATIFPHINNTLKISFNEPQLAVTPGQHAVLYMNDVVIGGGVIQEAFQSSPVP